jgi:nucleoside-diphosphate-sugar epimerase
MPPHSIRRVLITGARGFIGQAIVRLLRARGVDIVALSRTHEPGYCTVDVLDEASVQALLRETAPSHLVHAAWRPVHGDVLRSPENLSWLQASLSLVRNFAESGGQRALALGTAAEYDWSDGHCRNGVTPLRPATLYGTCKHALHITLEAYAREAGIGFAWTRVFDVFGPGERPTRLVPAVVGALLRGQPAECTHGRQLRDYLYVDDLAAGIIAALESDHQGAIDIASGSAVTVREVVETVARLVGREDLLRLGARPASPADAPLVVGDGSEARERLGWTPAYSLEQGIAETIAWTRRQHHAG